MALLGHLGVAGVATGSFKGGGGEHGKGVKMVMLYHLKFSLSRKRKYFCSSMKSCFFLYDVVMTKAGDGKKSYT